MNCPKCESKLREKAKFCDQCGARVVEPEKTTDLSPVVFRLLEGAGTGLKFIGGVIQDWAKSVKEEAKGEEPPK